MGDLSGRAWALPSGHDKHRGMPCHVVSRMPTSLSPPWHLPGLSRPGGPGRPGLSGVRGQVRGRLREGLCLAPCLLLTLWGLLSLPFSPDCSGGYHTLLCGLLSHEAWESWGKAQAGFQEERPEAGVPQRPVECAGETDGGTLVRFPNSRDRCKNAPLQGWTSGSFY